MQDIATKIARVRPVAAAAGLTSDQMRHLIHGTGGSPRRAKRAIKAGVAEVLIDAYVSALDDGLAHVQAVAKCNELWKGMAPGTEPGDDAEDDATVH